MQTFGSLVGDCGLKRHTPRPGCPAGEIRGTSRRDRPTRKSVPRMDADHLANSPLARVQWTACSPAREGHSVSAVRTRPVAESRAAKRIPISVAQREARGRERRAAPVLCAWRHVCCSAGASPDRCSGSAARGKGVSQPIHGRSVDATYLLSLCDGFGARDSALELRQSARSPSRRCFTYRARLARSIFRVAHRRLEDSRETAWKLVPYGALRRSGQYTDELWCLGSDACGGLRPLWLVRASQRRRSEQGACVPARPLAGGRPNSDQRSPRPLDHAPNASVTKSRNAVTRAGTCFVDG
jgi:hypothetical protein